MYSRSHRSRRPSRQKTPRPAPQPAWGDYALVRVDAVPVRMEALKACKRARTTFEKAEAELLYFEQKDAPAFDAWHRVNFGPQLKELEALERELAKARERVEKVMYMRMREGFSGREAKRQVEAEEKAEMDAEQAFSSAGEKARDHAERFSQQEQKWRELVEEFKAFLQDHAQSIRKSLAQRHKAMEIRQEIEHFFMKEMEMPAHVGRAFFRREDVEQLWGKHNLAVEQDPAEALSPASPEARIKRLMRELAFALHPDQCGVADQRRLELWHQVQEAVKAKDLDRLEVLHAHMQVLQGDVGPGLSVGRILDLTRNYRKSREALRRKIRELRKSKAWGFSLASAADKESLRRKAEAGYKATLRNLREDLASAEAFYKELCRK